MTSPHVCLCNFDLLNFFAEFVMYIVCQQHIYVYKIVLSIIPKVKLNKTFSGIA